MLSDEELIGGYLNSLSFAFYEKRPPRKYVYLLAEHEVGFSRRVLPVLLKQFFTNHSAHVMLLICVVGFVSRRARTFVSTLRRGYVLPEWDSRKF